jgi:putative ABC transport system ATP-binding protein
VIFAQRQNQYDGWDIAFGLYQYRPGMTNSFITLRGVSRTYSGASGGFNALADIDLSIDRGQFVAIVGHSGSGKSTLLNLLSGIDRPTQGEIHVAGTAVHGLSEGMMSKWRGRAVGIVFQFFQLLPTLTAMENVMLPMDFSNRWRSGERRKRALELLDKLGVSAQAGKLPQSMSGGEQQRVAVARAMANEPEVLLADEPTGNLDSKSAQAMLELLATLQREGQTIVMVTHDERAQKFASQVVTLVDGRMAQPSQLVQ